MASDTVSPQGQAYDSGRLDSGSGRWVDEFWTALIGAVDGRLRVYYGIREFSDDERCILRIAIDPSPMQVLLTDGTTIEEGTPVGALHLWNEHVPRFPPNGPDFAWANSVRRQFVHTLRLLADRAENDPELRRLPGFRGEALLATRLGLAQLDRVAVRLGFEPVDTPGLSIGPLRRIGDSLNVWALTRAYNPAALPRHGWIRERHELWMSRAKLIALYGAGSRAAAQAGRSRPTQ